MYIRPCTKADCYQVAELALMAGEGIPAFFWEQSRKDNEDIFEVGARKLQSDNDNFSYRNVSVAIVDNKIAGMLLAYRLPSPHHEEPLDDYPEFIRPLIELEQCVPDTFYINMLASFPEYRGQGVGSKLMGYATDLARQSDCNTLSLEVFEDNENAVRLYRLLGYSVLDQRDVVPHPCHTHHGKILLFTKVIS